MSRKNYFTGSHGGKVVTSSSRRRLAKQAIKKYALSIREACRLFRLSRSVYYYAKSTCEDDVVKNRLLELARLYPHYGYWKLYYLLRDEGHIVNHKRIYRLYKCLLHDCQNQRSKKEEGSRDTVRN